MGKTNGQRAYQGTPKAEKLTLVEEDHAGRLDVITAATGNDDYAEVFAAMGASRVIIFDKSSRIGGWCFLVKIRGTWRFACQEKIITGAYGFKYYISHDEVLNDPVGGDLKVEVEAVLRSEDPAYFGSRNDWDQSF